MVTFQFVNQNFMFLRKLFLKAMQVSLLFIFTTSYSQDKTVTGIILSNTGNPVESASVQVKNLSGSALSDSKGSFSIKVPLSATALLISSVGYEPMEVSIAGKTNVSITLNAFTKALDEVVVTAYGTRKRGDLTGSITSVSAKDFQKGNIASPEQLLVGKVAGLSITSGGGSAGGGSRIRIRGGASLNAGNDPLIVIDGVPVEGTGVSGSANLLNTINANDIESISVLKDASAAALYGSRASNGVLIITTKKGTRGDVKYNYNNTLSVSKIGKTVDVLSAEQVSQIINNDATATGNNTYKNLLGTANTNWQDEIYQAAFGFDNSLSASGSIGKVPFRASVGYFNQDGTLKTNNFNRISSSLNLSPKFLDDHLSVNLALKAIQTHNQFADEGAIGNAISFDPTKTVLSGNKNWGGYYEWLQADLKPIDLSNRNPLGLLNLRDNQSKVGRIIGNVQLDYKLHFFPDLHIQANLGIDNISGSGNNNIDSVSATNYRTGGRRSFYEQKKVNQLADVSIYYAKEIKSIKSKIDVLAGHSYQSFLTKVFNYPSFSYRAIADPTNLGKKDTIQGSEPTFPTDRPEFRLESYIGRVNFTVNDKYLLTASIRSDASSKLNPNDRVGYFPAVALAWKMKDDLFKSSKLIDDLKMRLGWGVTGQQGGIGFYSYIPRYTQGALTARYQFGNAFVNYLRPEGYDPNLKWETTTTSNIGFDYGLLKNRISGSVDYYYRETKDLLANVAVASGANFVNEITTNVGNIRSQGLEFTLNTTPIVTKDIKWDFGINYTYNNAEITNLLKNPDPNFKGQEVSGIDGGTGNRIGMHAVGYSPFTYRVYKQIYSPDGKPIEGLYEDINRDGIVNDDDRYLYKKPAADVLLGVNTQVQYKQFSFGLAGHAALGNYLYNNYFSNNAVLRNIKDPINYIRNVSVNYLDTRFSNNQYLSDYYIENASFFRLDNINLGYNVGSVLRDKARLNINASIQNVFVISKYKGLDPENAGDGGVDNNIYPRPRIFSLGFNFDF